MIVSGFMSKIAAKSTHDHETEVGRPAHRRFHDREWNSTPFRAGKSLTIMKQTRQPQRLLSPRRSMIDIGFRLL
jgi:hypothetical protein